MISRHVHGHTMNYRFNVDHHTAETTPLSLQCFPQYTRKETCDGQRKDFVIHWCQLPILKPIRNRVTRLTNTTSKLLEWLRQLTCVIDDLNFKYGIVHQDVAARNLLVNPETDALMLFDFNYSGRIGDTGSGKDRDDVKGVIFTLHEIITRDTHFREVPHDQQNPADVEGLEEWIQHPDVKLDHSVSEYRSVLNEWVKSRREGKQLAIYTEAPEYIDWPDFPEPAATDMNFTDARGNPIVVKWVRLSEMRRDKREKDIAVLNWERPAQTKLGNGNRVFANGQLVCSTECIGSGDRRAS